MKPKDIAEKLDADKRQISMWAAKFCNGGGIKELVPNVGGRYHENMTLEAEKHCWNNLRINPKRELVSVNEIK